MNRYFSFIDETGLLDESKNIQPYFGVGLLKIEDVSLLTEKLTQKHYDYYSSQKEKRREMIKSLKDNPRRLTEKELDLLLLSTRHYEYKFTKITPTTLEKYKQFLDTAFDFPLYFCALVIDKSDEKFTSAFYKNYWEAYISYSKLVCKHNCSNGNMAVIADYMNRPAKSDKYFEDELNKLPNVYKTIRANSESFLLLQLTDLLLGSTVFQWRQVNGFVKESNRARAKQEFVEYLVLKLKIPSEKLSKYPLAQKITCNKPYFNVWPLELSDNKQNGGV